VSSASRSPAEVNTPFSAPGSVSPPPRGWSAPVPCRKPGNGDSPQTRTPVHGWDSNDDAPPLPLVWTVAELRELPTPTIQQRLARELWRFDERDLTLTSSSDPNRWVALTELTCPAAILDAILEAASRTSVTNEDLGSLVRAVDIVCGPIADTAVDPEELIRKKLAAEKSAS
jgi:hypothetical protein